MKHCKKNLHFRSLSNSQLIHFVQNNQSCFILPSSTLILFAPCSSCNTHKSCFYNFSFFKISSQFELRSSAAVHTNHLLINPIEEGFMEINASRNVTSMLWFFRDKGFDDRIIDKMFKKCRRLEAMQNERAFENWEYLERIGIQKRKLPFVVSKCPKILALGLQENLVPMVECLATLSAKPREIGSAIAKFPGILSYSVEEKLCPLLAFFQALGVSEKQLGKMILLNPRLISYSIESKLVETVDFLAGIGLTKEGMIGKVLAKNPFLMGYSVHKRLYPTSEFLKSIGLKEMDLQAVALKFPDILCRDVDKVLRPNLVYLRNCGFRDGEIVSLVSGYPPILIKSIQHSLEPRIRFLVETMGRKLNEVTEYPDFFKHGLKKRLELRHRLLKEKNVDFTLSELLDCNQKKFMMKMSLL